MFKTYGEDITLVRLQEEVQQGLAVNGAAGGIRQIGRRLVQAGLIIVAGDENDQLAFLLGQGGAVIAAQAEGVGSEPAIRQGLGGRMVVVEVVGPGGTYCWRRCCWRRAGGCFRAGGPHSAGFNREYAVGAPDIYGAGGPAALPGIADWVEDLDEGAVAIGIRGGDGAGDSVVAGGVALGIAVAPGLGDPGGEVTGHLAGPGGRGRLYGDDQDGAGAGFNAVTGR